MMQTTGMKQVAASRERRRPVRILAAAVLALLLMFSASSAAWAAEDAGPARETATPGPEQVDEALAVLQASLAKQEPVSDWAAFALARGGKPVKPRYMKQLEKIKPDSFRIVTAYARTALAVNANGWDARAAGPAKIDLLGAIANFEKMTAQGPNGPAFALMALDAGGYASGKDDLWNREKLVKWLVEQRARDGGWSLVPGESDVDVTGIVLAALAPYKDREDVKPAVEGALAWLSAVQLDNGGFGQPETSESTAQTLIALTALDIDPASDPRFVKNGKSALARLFEFRLPDGTFAHLPGGKSDSLASLYALLGLTAVDRWQDGLPGLYSGVRPNHPASVTVYGPEGKLASGIGTGRTAMESLIQVLQSSNIAYEVERHPQFGPYLQSISTYDNGMFGGFDGWQYAVRIQGKWVHGLPGLSTYEPAGGAALVIFYGESPALIHSVRLDPASPREGLPITVTVEQEIYDWDAGKAVVSPAQGARVTLGGVSAVTDREGKAVLEGFKSGRTTLRVDGYRAGAAPAFVPYEQPLEVEKYAKTVTVRVEGDKEPIAQGRAEGGTALEALENFLKSRGIPIVVEEMSFGKYVASIDGIDAGRYGGFDGWMFAVKDGGDWIYPAEGIGTFLLDEGQELVVYYGGEQTKIPDSPMISPARAKPGDTVEVRVTHRPMDWDAGKLQAAEPLPGVQVTAAGKSAMTDKAGLARLTGLPEGIHEVVVSGYSPDGAPEAVRTVGRVTVAGDYLDQNRISAWAADWVRDARASGVLLGTGDRKDGEFQPQAPITRAEFVVSLVRALGLKPAEGSTFRDVAPDAWYAGEIEAAAQAGLVAGTAPGRFAPEDRLTREQAAQLLARALDIRASRATSFADSAQVSAGAAEAVQAVLEQGWMTVQEDGRFLPKMTMPREQAAVIAVRVLFREGIGALGGR